MKILVVEDLLIMRRVIVNALNALGYEEVFAADGGDTALEIMEEENIEFLVTDWLMPGMDGIELVKHVRNNPKYQNLPIIMLTSMTDKNNVREALNAKVDDYVIKPFTIETLKLKIMTLKMKYNIF